MTRFNTCIILNGPPGVGKDTLGEVLSQKYKYSHMRFKTQVYKETVKLFSIKDAEEFERRATHRKLKELPWEKLPHPITQRLLSPRQALIFTSEEYIKPAYGKDYFGRMAENACRHFKLTDVVFSDGGFTEEVNSLSFLYPNLIIFQLHREGFTWKGDSRTYIQGHPNTKQILLKEDEIDEAILEMVEYISWVKGEKNGSN